MTNNRRWSNVQPVGDVATRLLDPVLRRKAGISTALVQSWPEIAGQRIAENSQPERILWPKRARDDDPFEPATLVVACTGIAALHLQHETGELINRINAFLGFGAIGRVRIVQKPIPRFGPAPRPTPRPLTAQEDQRISKVVGMVEDEGLRASLAALGASIARRKR
ncbi:MAG: DciA family protein [Mesorhizobium sp.]